MDFNMIMQPATIKQWHKIPFFDCLQKVKLGREKQVKERAYLKTGLFPIVDQGQSFIAGYTDDKDKVISGIQPFIIFGDHTRILKYIDFPIALGADGTKVIKPKESFDTKYFFYFLKYLDIPSRGYNRHFTILKEKNVLQPSLPEQKTIARVLTVVQEAITGQEVLITKFKELKRSMMQHLFTDGAISGFMFDTNIFDEILDGKISMKALSKKFKYYVTHIQEDEILAIKKNTKRKKGLLMLFNKLNGESIPTETAVFGISKFGGCKFGGGIYFESIKKNNPKHIEDALIGETAILNSLILVTNDSCLASKVRLLGGEVISFIEFVNKKFRKTKMTEIGEIPKSWDVFPLQVVANVTMGQSPSSKTYNANADGLPFYQGKTDFGSKYPRLRIYCNAPARVADIGDILISVRAPVGPVNIANTKCCIGRGIGAIHAKNKFNQFFLYFYLIFSEKIIASQGTGSTFHAINKNQLANFTIPVPERNEQDNIVKTLIAIDQKIDAGQEKLSVYQNLFKTLLHELMSGERRVKINKYASNTQY